MKIERLCGGPIIKINMDGRMGDNVNGPSLIRVPEWIKNPLGKYYLYFAHHKGKYIRLAYSDNIEGPWKIYEPGTLQIEQTKFSAHIASPDVHIDNENKEIRLYYHGAGYHMPGRGQLTCLALSKDGLNFEDEGEVLGGAYWRVFKWNGYYYALEKPGLFLRSKDGISNFEEGPRLFLNQKMRHCAVTLRENTLHVLFSNVGGCPESIMYSKVKLTEDWLEWKESTPNKVMEPEMEYEGVNQPLECSIQGRIHGMARQLRDPEIYVESENTYLLYSVAGENGIGLAKIVEWD